MCIVLCGSVSFHTCSPARAAMRKINKNPGNEQEADIIGYVLQEAKVEYNHPSKLAVG